MPFQTTANLVKVPTIAFLHETLEANAYNIFLNTILGITGSAKLRWYKRGPFDIFNKVKLLSENSGFMLINGEYHFTDYSVFENLYMIVISDRIPSSIDICFDAAPYFDKICFMIVNNSMFECKILFMGEILHWLPANTIRLAYTLSSAIQIIDMVPFGYCTDKVSVVTNGDAIKNSMLYDMTVSSNIKAELQGFNLMSQSFIIDISTEQINIPISQYKSVSVFQQIAIDQSRIIIVPNVQINKELIIQANQYNQLSLSIKKETEVDKISTYIFDSLL